MTGELEQVRDIQKAFEQEFERFADIEQQDLSLGAAQAAYDAISELNIRFLGKKSELSNLSRSLGSVPQEHRRDVGQSVFDARDIIKEKIMGKIAFLLLYI